MKKKVLLRSAILSRSGYGENSRLVLRALRKYEDNFEIFLLAINWGQTSWDARDSEERKWIDATIQKTQMYMQQGGQFDISVQVTIPNEWERMAPINIGVTAGIESDKISSKWVEKCQVVDKIIVVSEHAKYGFDVSSYEAQHPQTKEIVKDFRNQKPISVIGYPVLKFEEKPVELELEHDFNFLVVCQDSPRKNLVNTIKWFLEEFKNTEVGLVLKTSLRNNSVMDRMYSEKKLKMLLKGAPEHKCKIYLLHGFLDEGQMQFLYNHPKIKALVSLAHGEGFGLPLFEAAYNGMPVICPNWGGQLDFLVAEKKNKKTKQVEKKEMFAAVDYDIAPVQKEVVWQDVLIADSKWCFPKENSAKRRLRSVYDEYNRYKQQALKLQKILVDKYTEEDIYRQYAEVIGGEKIKVINKEDLPTCSIITSVFDGAEYIEEFCKDVVRQTVFKEKCDWVLAHPKNSPGFEKEKEVIERYAKEYPNIVYLQLDTDPGIYGCWNVGVKNSKGQYITNWNLDDRRHPLSIERYLREVAADVTLDGVYMDSLITYIPNETFENNSSVKDGKQQRYNFPEYNFEVLKMTNVLHATPVWSRELHNKNGYFEEKYKSAGDWCFFLECGSKGAKFKKINDCLSLYYFSPKGLSTDPKNNSWKREEEKEVWLKYKDIKLG